ncbi:hypothetical protein TNCV_17881 [Trichonephila clavipes]|nr:hypothetical protein TNCV_17881 [Trichonephila clavipes]
MKERGFRCPIVSSEEFVAVGDDNVCTARIMTYKDILEFVQSSKNIIDRDSDDELIDHLITRKIKAIGDEPRNFEPWSSDEEGTGIDFSNSKLLHLSHLKTWNLRQI